MSVKVCIVSFEYPPASAFGGIARASHAEARALASAGATVHVITLTSGPEADRGIDEGVMVHRLPVPRLELPADMPYVNAAFWSKTVAAYFATLDKQVRFDVVQVQDYLGESLYLEPRPGLPVVARLHALSAVVGPRSGRERSPGERVLEGMELAALEACDLVLAPTELILSETRALLGEALPPARLHPLILDMGRFTRGPRRDRPADAPLDLVFVGRLEPLKRPDLALHATAAAVRAGIDCRITLVGRDIDGHRAGVLGPLMEQLGLDFDRVRFVAQLDEAGVLSHLQAADCAILPSRFENFHMAALEALSCGVPVITSDRGGLSGWIGEADGLVALPIEDPDSFARLAAATLADRAALAAAGRRAEARVRELFDATALAERQLEIYRELAAPAPRAAPAPAAAAGGGPRVGVVVLAHNALEYTQRCVQSVLAHTAGDVRLYLVDNASTDGTSEWCRDLDPRVTVLRCEENRGVSGGRNVGIEAVQRDGADYVVFLDNDVEVFEDWLDPFLAALDADPEAGIAGEMGVRVRVHETGRDIQAMVGEPGPAEADIVVGYCMVMRAATVRQVGRFDENLGLFWHDDDDYCLRAARLGYRVLHVASGRLIHFEHRSSEEVPGLWQAREVASDLSAANRRYLAEKWRSGAAGVDGSRPVAVLAFADELIAYPELLAAFAGAFGADEPVTLVLPVADAAAAQEGVLAAVAATGLDADALPDLALIGTGDARDSELTVAAAADAVLSRRAPAGFAHALAHFGDDDVSELRELVERRWRALGVQLPALR